MKLFPLATARDWVRSDSTDDDSLLEAILETASDLVVTYLGTDALERLGMLNSDAVIEEDSNGVATADVPGAVLGATRYLVAWLYRNRDADPEKAFTPGYLPAPVTAMLYPLRDPVLA